MDSQYGAETLSARLIGLFIIIFVIQWVVCGFTAVAFISATVISALAYFYVSLQPQSVASLVNRSLEQQILPQVSTLTELSRAQSHQAMLDISVKVNHLRVLHLRMVGDEELSELELQESAKQIALTFKELLVLLQFGDRLEQQQAGIIESVELIQVALRNIEKQGWDEESILQVIERIEQRTRPENDKSPAQEGSVTFF